MTKSGIVGTRIRLTVIAITAVDNICMADPVEKSD
jgi:poly(A) polymerase Pap1